MSHIEAVFRDGAFHPLEPVNFSDDQRVRLLVEEKKEKLSLHEWLEQAKRLQQSIIASHGILPDSTPLIAADRLR